MRWPGVHYSVTLGLGVYQQGLNYCQKLVNDGKWVHMFPEGNNIMPQHQIIMHFLFRKNQHHFKPSAIKMGYVDKIVIM